MAETIRLRVWLLGLGPVVVVVGAAIALFVGSGKKPAPREGVAASEPLASAPAAPDTPAPLPSPTVSAAVAPPPPPAPVPPIVAAAASSVILSGPPPEPIPELDALFRPKGSDGWTTEQKVAYRDQALHALDAKERTLEQELAMARRRGDTEALQEKQATLDYLRARRASIEEAMKRHDPLRDALQDGGN